MFRSRSSPEVPHRAGRAAAAWALLAVSLLTAAPGVVGAQPAQTIDDHLHWRGEVVLSSDILVPLGSTLVIAPGTNARPMPGSSVELVLHGRLDARGNADELIGLGVPVRLVGPGTTGARLEHAVVEPPENSDACGLSLEGASLTGRHLTVRGWGTGICVSGSADPPTPPTEPRPHGAASGFPVPMSASELSLTDPTRFAGAQQVADESLSRLSRGPFLVLDDARFEENGVGVRLAEDASDVWLTNVSFVNNDVGVEQRGGRAFLDHASFTGNRVWDVDSPGSPRTVHLYGSSFAPSCMNVGASPPSVCQRGVVPRAPLVALFALLVLFWQTMMYWAARVVAIVRLFGRIEREDLLDHPLRARIHTIVIEEPGIHLRELARRLGAYGTIAYHVNRLELGGLVRSEHAGAFRRFYARGQDEAEPALLHPRERLLAFVDQHPGVRPSHAARRLGLSRQLVDHHVRHLEQDGHLTRFSRGARTFLFALPRE